MRHDDLPPLAGQPFHHLGGRWCSRTETVFDRQDKNATARAKQGTPLHKARQRLIHGGAVSQVQQFLWQPQGRLPASRRHIQDSLGTREHGRKV
jgi:hypothetical protein